MYLFFRLLAVLVFGVILLVRYNDIRADDGLSRLWHDLVAVDFHTISAVTIFVITGIWLARLLTKTWSADPPPVLVGDGDLVPAKPAPKWWKYLIHLPLWSFLAAVGLLMASIVVYAYFQQSSDPSPSRLLVIDRLGVFLGLSPGECALKTIIILVGVGVSLLIVWLALTRCRVGLVVLVVVAAFIIKIGITPLLISFQRGGDWVVEKILRAEDRMPTTKDVETKFNFQDPIQKPDRKPVIPEPNPGKKTSDGIDLPPPVIPDSLDTPIPTLLLTTPASDKTPAQLLKEAEERRAKAFEELRTVKSDLPDPKPPVTKKY